MKKQYKFNGELYNSISEVFNTANKIKNLDKIEIIEMENNTPAIRSTFLLSKDALFSNMEKAENNKRFKVFK